MAEEVQWRLNKPFPQFLHTNKTIQRKCNSCLLNYTYATRVHNKPALSAFLDQEPPYGQISASPTQEQMSMQTRLRLFHLMRVLNGTHHLKQRRDKCHFTQQSLRCGVKLHEEQHPWKERSLKMGTYESTTGVHRETQQIAAQKSLPS